MKNTFLHRLLIVILLVFMGNICYGQKPHKHTEKKPDTALQKKPEKPTAKKSKKKAAPQAEGGERATFTQNVCMFGLARSYQDSITYFTNIAPIQKAVFDKETKFMDGLNLYTEQLETYLLKNGHAGYICATFYYKSMKEAERGYLKMRKKISKLKFTSVEPLGDFQYQFVSPDNIYRNVLKQRGEDDSDSDDNTDAPTPQP